MMKIFWVKNGGKIKVNKKGTFREDSEEVESPSKVATNPNWDPVGIIDFGIESFL